MKFKKILIGLNTFSPDWLKNLKNINQPNIILCDFTSQKLNEILSNNEDIYYILPLSEDDYMNIKKNINCDKYKILYPSEKNYDLLNDKVKFTKYMMEKFSNYIPKVYFLSNVNIDEDITYPLISKPNFSTNGKGMLIINNQHELKKCTNKVIIQKYIDFTFEYGCFFLCIDGKIINHKTIAKSYPKYNIKKTNFINYIEIKNFPIEIIEKITMDLNYTGGGNIDFKYDEEHKQIYIFEFNPRFGGSAFTNNFIYELLCVE